MSFLLDTNTIIALLKDPLGGVVSSNLRTAGLASVATSSIVVAELISGAHRGAPERLEQNLANLRALRFDILSFDAADAASAGEADAALKKRGKPIGRLDILIAGQALARGLTVVTNNTREFKRVPGLSVVDWTV
jgi:tRNA(fMet)-specific endonuclease VapC